jgi:hypothetical protein
MGEAPIFYRSPGAANKNAALRGNPVLRTHLNHLLPGILKMLGYPCGCIHQSLKIIADSGA